VGFQVPGRESLVSFVDVQRGGRATTTALAGLPISQGEQSQPVGAKASDFIHNPVVVQKQIVRARKPHSPVTGADGGILRALTPFGELVAATPLNGRVSIFAGTSHSDASMELALDRPLTAWSNVLRKAFEVVRTEGAGLGEALPISGGLFSSLQGCCGD
jgi:hypothetical protein